MIEPSAGSKSASEMHLVDLRRDLHRHPELRFEEHRTAGLLSSRLREAGFTVREGIGGTGVVGTLGSGEPYVVLRADMDALPVQDAKKGDHASTRPGVSHACGHDVHMTVVMGVAERLAARTGPGRVGVIFQPAEERPFGEPSGAAAMLAADVFDGRTPDVILGLHCWPDLPAGTVGVDERVAMGAKDAFRVHYRGRAAHAATPSRGRDAILGMAQLVTTLHQNVARSIDPSDAVALNIGTIAGGASQSVVASEARITGTVRTIDVGVRARLRGVIEQTVTGVAASSGLTDELTWADEMPPVLNEPRLVERAIAVVARTIGSEHVQRLTSPPMTADDFALFGQLAPTLYLKLGVAGSGPWPALHSGTFDVDERCIETGVDVLAALVSDILQHPLE
ncbi:MAG: M20 family metallopeptidase [Candidatus Limnocylindrales bacterium]